MRGSTPTVALGDLASIIVSGVDKHIKAGEQEVRLCNYLDVYRNRRLRDDWSFSAGTAKPVEVRRFALKRGDVVITKDSETPDDIGIPCLIDDDLTNVICGYHLAVLRPDGDLDSAYLLHYLQSEAAKRHFLRMANGLTRFGIGYRAIASLPVQLPSRQGQRRIALVLDGADAAIAAATAETDRASTVRQSLLADLTARGIGEEGRLRQGSQEDAFKSTPVGMLPTDWNVSSVDAELSLQTGITLNEAKRGQNKTQPYLRVANVRRYAIDLGDVQLLAATERELTGRRLDEDDLLVVEGHANRREIGRCALVPREAVGMTFQNHLFRLRTRGQVVPVFACLWLNSEYAQRYWDARCGTSSGLNTINQPALRRLLLPVPKREEQQRIVELAAAQRAHVDALSAARAAMIDMKRSLLKDAMRGGEPGVPVTAAATS